MIFLIDVVIALALIALGAILGGVFTLTKIQTPKDKVIIEKGLEKLLCGDQFKTFEWLHLELELSPWDTDALRSVLAKKDLYYIKEGGSDAYRLKTKVNA